MQLKTLVVCVHALFLLLTISTVQGAPRLAIDQPDFDFGYVPHDARISHVFWLKSTGDDVLKIIKVVPGCGCTKAPIEKTELAAGDSTRLEVIFNTKGYRSKVTKSPRIETTEGTPHKKVSFTAHVVPPSESTYPIIITPFELDLSQSGEKTPNAIGFTIANVSEADLRIALVDHPEGYFDFEFPEIIRAGETAQGRLKLHEDTAEISFEKSITIELNDETNTRFTIPVKNGLQATDKEKRAQTSGRGN